MKLITTTATLLALGGLAFAAPSTQEGKSETPSAAADDVSVSPGQQEFEALEKEASQAFRDWRLAYRKASEEERKALAAQDPMAAFLPRFQAAANRYAGTDAAVPFHVWIVQWGPRIQPDAAADSFLTVLTVHGQSPALKGLVSTLPDYDRIVGDQSATALAAIRNIAQNHPDLTVQGWATFAAHKHTLKEGEIGSEAYNQAKAAVTAKALAAGDEWLARQTKSTIGIREHFSLGMVAPEIQALDLDGVEFKLSDYRGNVVFVDFWGDW